MKQDEIIIQEAKELLDPLCGRSNLDPHPHFTEELYDKLVTEQNKSKRIFSYKPLLASAAFFLLLTVIAFSYFDNLKPALQEPQEEINYPIEEFSSLKKLYTIEYGDDKNQIGLYYMNAKDSHPFTHSFDVHNETFYILDEVNQQVVIIDATGKMDSFKFEEDKSILGNIEDILVAPDGEIYILDSSSGVVYQYSTEYNLVETHIIDKTYLLSITSELIYLESEGVMVSGNQEKYYSLDKKQYLNETDIPFQVQNVHQKEDKITINKDDEHSQFSYIYEVGNGVIDIESISQQGILIAKTESARSINPSWETHALLINDRGKTLAGVRIPREEWTMVPNHFIAVDQNKIYLLSPEYDGIHIYQLTLGKNFDSKLKQQVEENSIGFDINTFGQPFPELKEKIEQLFVQDTIFANYGYEGTVNGVAIDEKGTVVVDFKHFLAPGPSTYERQQISTALYQAIFESFPEVQEVYLQFDGSFSAWCSWLEITEEPWKRKE